MGQIAASHILGTSLISVVQNPSRNWEQTFCTIIEMKENYFVVILKELLCWKVLFALILSREAGECSELPCLNTVTQPWDNVSKQGIWKALSFLDLLLQKWNLMNETTQNETAVHEFFILETLECLNFQFMILLCSCSPSSSDTVLSFSFCGRGGTFSVLGRLGNQPPSQEFMCCLRTI